MQVEQLLEDNAPDLSDAPPMLKVLIRRSVRMHPHSGQGGFLARELRRRSSKRQEHRGHWNS